MNILIIENQIFQANGIKDLVQSLSREYQVIDILFNSDQVSKFLNRDNLAPVDIVLQDIRMENDDELGIKIAQLFRQRYPAIKIIAITEHHQEIIFHKIYHAGFSGYLQKENLNSPPRLNIALQGAISGFPFWDAPGEWIIRKPEAKLLRKYLEGRWRDLPESHQRRYQKNFPNDAEPWLRMDYDPSQFYFYQIDEMKRIENDLTETEWEIFKRIACGESKNDIVNDGITKDNAFNTHIHNIKLKLFEGKEGENWQVWFLIHALRCRVPEVIETVQNRARIFIRTQD